MSFMSVVLSGMVLLLMCRGFTSMVREDFMAWRREGRLVNSGVHAQVRHDCSWM